MTEPYDGPACEVPGCTRPQAPGWYLCASDGRWLGDALARLGDRYGRLTPAKSMAAPEPGTGHGGSLASQRDPVRLHAVVLTDRRRGTGRIGADDADDLGLDDTPSVFGVLAGYAATVREARNILRPRITSAIPLGNRPPGPLCEHWCGHDSCRRWTLRGTSPAPLTVATERAVLAAQLDWILGQEWAADFHSDITALWTLLSGGGRTVGTCGQCGGPVTYANRAASCACGTRAGLDLIELSTGRTA